MRVYVNLYSMKYFNSKEVASMFDCNESTVRRWADKGLLPCNKTPGGHRYFTIQNLRTFIKNSESEGKKKMLRMDGKEIKQIFSHIINSEYFDIAKHLANKSIVSDELSVKNIIYNLYLYGTNLTIIFDQVIEKCHDVVEQKLTDGKISHSEEYISRKLITRVIESLCENKPNGINNGKNALCINFEDNLPDIGIIMSEVILRHQGYNVLNTGSHAQLGDLKLLLNNQKIDIIIFYLCNRQCCNAVALKNIDKTILQTQQIIKVAESCNIKVLFGGPGIKFINKSTQFKISSFITFDDLNLLI